MALTRLETERARLEGELTRAQAKAVLGVGERLDELVDALLGNLDAVRDVLPTGTPEQRKAMIRSFLAGIRVEKATRQAVLRWYRLLRDLSLKVGGAEGS